MSTEPGFVLKGASRNGKLYSRNSRALREIVKNKDRRRTAFRKVLLPVDVNKPERVAVSIAVRKTGVYAVNLSSAGAGAASRVAVGFTEVHAAAITESQEIYGSVSFDSAFRTAFPARKRKPEQYQKSQAQGDPARFFFSHHIPGLPAGSGELNLKSTDL